MGHLWSIVQAHQDKYGPSISEIARRLGMKPSALHAWNKRGVKQLPRVENLHALADLTGTPYREVLKAALMDAGYEVEDTPPTTQAGHADAG